MEFYPGFTCTTNDDNDGVQVEVRHLVLSLLLLLLLLLLLFLLFRTEDASLHVTFFFLPRVLYVLYVCTPIVLIVPQWTLLPFVLLLFVFFTVLYCIIH